MAFDAKAATEALNGGRLEEEGRRVDGEGRQGPVPSCELLTVPAGRTRGWRPSRPPSPRPGRTSGSSVEVVETPAADLATKLRGGEFTAAVAGHHEGLEPDLYPLLASSQVRGSGTNLAGYQDPALDPLLEAARKPGTPEARMTAWKALLTGLAARLPLLPIAWHSEDVLLAGASTGPTRGSSRAPGTGSGMC